LFVGGRHQAGITGRDFIGMRSARACLGVTQTTARKLKHKLKQVMLERDATKRLTGRIEIDDAYLGGERSGGRRGRGAPGKTPFVAALETTTEGKPSCAGLPALAKIQGFATDPNRPPSAGSPATRRSVPCPRPWRGSRLARGSGNRRPSVLAELAHALGAGHRPRWIVRLPPALLLRHCHT
jgi:hypothetical protein